MWHDLYNIINCAVVHNLAQMCKLTVHLNRKTGLGVMIWYFFVVNLICNMTYKIWLSTFFSLRKLFGSLMVCSSNGLGNWFKLPMSRSRSDMLMGVITHWFFFQKLRQNSCIVCGNHCFNCDFCKSEK